MRRKGIGIGIKAFERKKGIRIGIGIDSKGIVPTLITTPFLGPPI